MFLVVFVLFFTVYTNYVLLLINLTETTFLYLRILEQSRSMPDFRDNAVWPFRSVCSYYCSYI